MKHNIELELTKEDIKILNGSEDLQNLIQLYASTLIINYTIVKLTVKSPSAMESAEVTGKQISDLLNNKPQ